MPTSSIQYTVNSGGASIQGQQTDTAEGTLNLEVTLAAGKAGTLTTRTDNDTGVATLSTGHGIISTDVVDVYWAGGLRRGMVATVSTNAVTIDGGAGSNLPSTTTALVVCKQTEAVFIVDGDLIQFFAVGANQRCSVDFQNASNTSQIAYQVLANTVQPPWSASGGLTSPYAGIDIQKAKLSNGSSTASCLVKVAALVDIVS
jgi:hypothetical protein